MKNNKLSVFLVPIQSKVVFPYQLMKMKLSEMHHYDAKQFNQYLGFVTLIENDMDGVKKVGKLAQYGTLVRITGEEYTIYSNNRIFVGLSFARFKIIEVTKTTPYYVASVEILADDLNEKETLPIDKLKQVAKTHLELFSAVDSRTIQLIQEEISVNKIVYQVANHADLTTIQKLKILQTDQHSEKITLLISMLATRNDEFQITKSIEDKVKKDMSETIKPQKKIEAPFSRLDDTGKMEERLKTMNIPQQVREVAEQELKKLKQMGSQHHEYSMLKNYLDLLLNLPWDKVSEENLSIDNAKKTLDKDHCGLTKVKDRILQFLAVRQLTKQTEIKSAMGSIICFHGPPGVGKTSLGQSIASALNRPFFRIALGGVSDEAQIRGHRRTYVGALPGQILVALKKVQCKNPVILLDEIDKLTSNLRGDPSSALLEVLDPEQNSKFVDNYLNLEFDLSQVLFIATANNIDVIAPALKDRLEMIEIPGYTMKEKIQIALNHLIPKQLKKNGLTKVTFPEESLGLLIKQYSAEAGVRQLERNIQSILRNTALKVVRGGSEEISIEKNQIIEIMGAAVHSDKNPLIQFPGVARGLAWTPYGGKVLMIETVRMVGKGRFEVTGSLGDVMKESVRTALGLIKAYWPQIKLLSKYSEDIDFDKIDLHIHFPAGGIPKDGPSAGIAITTALVSLLTGCRVKNNFAMTGEITLTGRVLPVGGVKEKLLGAYEAGIDNIIIPYRNKANLQDLDSEMKAQVHLVKTIDEVLFLALEGNGPRIKMINDFIKL